MSVNKEEIQELGLNAIKDYFKVDIVTLEPQFLKVLHDKAKLGMQFEREMNLSKRAGEMMSFRIMKLTAEDKRELKTYIKKSMPQYLP